LPLMWPGTPFSFPFCHPLSLPPVGIKGTALSNGTWHLGYGPFLQCPPSSFLPLRKKHRVCVFLPPVVLSWFHLTPSLSTPLLLSPLFSPPFWTQKKVGWHSLLFSPIGDYLTCYPFLLSPSPDQTPSSFFDEIQQ